METPPPDGGRGLSGGDGDKAIGLRAREEMDVITRTSSALRAPYNVLKNKR
jgi:hypothetical protein